MAPPLASGASLFPAEPFQQIMAPPCHRHITGRQCENMSLRMKEAGSANVARLQPQIAGPGIESRQRTVIGGGMRGKDGCFERCFVHQAANCRATQS